LSLGPNHSYFAFSCKAFDEKRIYHWISVADG
jgi:hypothetical protein